MKYSSNLATQSFLIVLTTSFVLLGASLLNAQSFSCTFGRAACLDYGDTVCSASGKCVASSAVCFNSYQCGYEGFTCKSNVTECVDDYNDLLRKNNVLIDDYNSLLNTNSDLVGDYNDILGKYNVLIHDYNDLLSTAENLEDDLDKAKSELQELNFCLSYASTLSGAMYCAY